MAKVLSEKDIIGSLITDINKDFSEKTAFLLEEKDSPSHIKSWVSTGCTPLDLLISNGFSEDISKSGIPCGRMSLLTGLQSSGKTLLGSHIIANCQKQDGLAVFIDSENSIMPDFLKVIGVDTDKLVYVQTNSLETAFKVMQRVIGKIIERKLYDKPTIIFVDSFAGLDREINIDTEDKQGYSGAKKAAAISKTFGDIQTLIGRYNVGIVFTTQLRDNMKAGIFGDPYRTTGGHALNFYPSVHVRFSRVGNLTDKNKEVVGVKVKAKLLKNRMGPNFRETEFIMRFANGINNIESIIQEGNRRLLFGKSSKKVFVRPNGEEFEFQLSKPSTFRENKDVLREIVEELRRKIHIPYESIDNTLDDELELIDDGGEIIDIGEPKETGE